jgi:hypothetical protein
LLAENKGICAFVPLAAGNGRHEKGTIKDKVVQARAI